ncbi:MAG: acyltransferase domain-containing protein [Acidothermus sp.]|nr:acyltransferase domain-containing protein [Acidothermus sp.]
MLAIVAPGQGAQTPGFLTPWLDLPAVHDLLTWWSAVVDLDLVHLGTKADAEEIKDTAVTQPLIVAAGLAAAASLLEESNPHDALAELPHHIAAAAGHSVGELTASAIAGVLSAEAALVLVRERGRAMAQAARLRDTGMTAVLGGDPQEVTAKIAELGLTAANINGAGQIVAAGTTEELAALATDTPAGSRLRPLAVAGAFHTEHMAPAVGRLRELAPGIPVRDPRTRLLSNADGKVVQHGPQMLDRLVAQVAAPVRWDQCMQTLAALGVTAVIELPPAGTLTGLIRRALPEVETLALKTPDDLPAARDLLARHRHEIEPTTVPSWRILVAPISGLFEKADVAVGDDVPAGTVIGRVVTKRETAEVVAVHRGTLVEWLAEDRDPVSPGQPLARLHPSPEVAS